MYNNGADARFMKQDRNSPDGFGGWYGGHRRALGFQDLPHDHCLSAPFFLKMG